jgi:DNA polymerase-1
MKKLFLLDAFALIYRAYYALAKVSQVNSKGQNTSAIYGFVNTLEDVLKRERPSHMAIVFDPPGPTFRHEAYAEYKAQRDSMPEVIRESIPIIKNIIRAYRIPILEAPHYEADDVIGTVARRLAGKYMVYIMTLDKDLSQLVNDHIFIYRPRYGSSEIDIMDEERVKEKYGLRDPLQIIDLLGLMGDTSDNIPGCPGVGEITAKKLIAQFGSIDNLLAHTHQLSGSLRKRIEDNREIITFSRFLATIRTDVPIEIDPHALLRSEIDAPALRKIFNELEFRQLAKRVLGDKLEKPAVEPVAEPVVEKSVPRQFSLFDPPETLPERVKEPELAQEPKVGNESEEEAAFDAQADLFDITSVPHTYSLLDGDAQINDLLRRIREQGSFVFDTETTGLDPLSAELVGISFALRKGEAFYLPVSEDSKEVRKIIRPFKEVLEAQDILKIGQHLKYDINVLKKYDIRVDGPLYDTMIAHYILNPEQRHNMDYLAETYLHYRTIPIERLIGGRHEKQLSMREVPLPVVVDYACEDADITLQLKQVFEKKIDKGSFNDLFYRVEMPLVPVLADMEEAGVRLDITALQESSLTLNKYLEDIEEEIFRLTKEIFNINSPKAVGEVLFNRLKVIAKPRKTKTGQYVTSEEVLESIKNKHPVIEKILEFRRTKKLLSTYVDQLPHLVRPADGKVHTTYNQTIASTGRLTSTQPNLQNIPIRREEGKDLRRAFIPDPHCLFLSADYSQIELRIMAHSSQDSNMLKAFHDGQDIHAATAAWIFDLPLEEVTESMRRKAKTANFGIIYGISIFGLSEQLNVSRIEAKDFIDGYFNTFPGIKDYIERSIALAREKGYVETICGRRRFLPDIHSRNMTIRGYSERNAINAPIQGSAADIIKIAMNRIYARFREENLQSRMIMQVHDELNFNVLAGELEQVKQIVVHEMEHAVELRVPLIATCGTGGNWLEAH